MLKELADAFPQLNEDLTAEQILDQCQRWVPVNTRIDAAIQAHRLAFGQYFRDGRVQDDSARDISMFALRAVILARSDTRADLCVACDYLVSLPEAAWPEAAEHAAAECREATLGGISRRLTWMAET